MTVSERRASDPLWNSTPWTSVILAGISLAAVVTVCVRWKVDPRLALLAGMLGIALGRAIATVSAAILSDDWSDRDNAAVAMALFAPIALWAFSWSGWIIPREISPQLSLSGVAGIALVIFAAPVILATIIARVLPKQWGIWRFAVCIQGLALVGFVFLATSVAPGMFTYDTDGQLMCHKEWTFLDLSSLRAGRQPEWMRREGPLVIVGLPDGWSAHVLAYVEQLESIPDSAKSVYHRLFGDGVIAPLTDLKRLPLDVNGDPKALLEHWLTSTFPSMTFDHLVVRYTAPTREWK